MSFSRTSLEAKACWRSWWLPHSKETERVKKVALTPSWGKICVSVKSPPLASTASTPPVSLCRHKAVGRQCLVAWRGKVQWMESVWPFSTTTSAPSFPTPSTSVLQRMFLWSEEGGGEEGLEGGGEEGLEGGGRRDWREGYDLKMV